MHAVCNSSHWNYSSKYVFRNFHLICSQWLANIIIILETLISKFSVRVFSDDLIYKLLIVQSPKLNYYAGIFANTPLATTKMY